MSKARLMRTKHYEVEQYFAEETGMILASAFFDCSILIDDKMLSVYSAGEHLSQIQKNIKTSMHFFFCPKKGSGSISANGTGPKLSQNFFKMEFLSFSATINQLVGQS
jgi:hypothetical protein